MNLNKAIFQFVIFIFVVSLVNADIVLARQKESISKPLHLSSNLAFELSKYDGELSRIVSSSKGMKLGVGLGYGSFLLELSGDIYGPEFSSEFWSNNQYPEDLVKLKKYSWATNIYFRSFGFKNLEIMPSVGLTSVYFRENNSDLPDFHPNWDLNADSRYRFSYGVRLLSSNIIFQKLAFLKKSVWSLYFEFKIASHEFKNQEYQSGNQYELSFGINWQYILKRNKDEPAKLH